MFNLVEELFSPGRGHTEEERQRMTLVVDDTGDSDPGKGPIDLSSGKVLVRPADPGAHAAPHDPDDPHSPDDPGAPDDPGDPHE
ncbi:hypothetical protein KGS77_09490 [Streptomyces sp. MST-110588]|nr:DUF6191 domain-containing protein [Streptomyces sp. MST-110588]UNO43807.1 hypothetical protein KGS77_09490 [Streptomyces sp. MST-110588]